MESQTRPVSAEAARIRAAYAHRDRTIPASRYSYFNPAHLYWMQQRETDFLRALRRAGWDDLAGRRILEVGCGDGEPLRRLLGYGARPEHLVGVDLLEDRIAAARRLAPNLEFHCANAESLPFEDAGFDLVYQLTVFTSILDDAARRRVAGEMLRVVKSAGLILWYDFRLNNPRNPDVRRVTGEEIRGLFPGCRIELRRVTLAPPITRALAPRSWLLCHVLERLPWLCTHYLGVIRKGVSR